MTTMQHRLQVVRSLAAKGILKGALNGLEPDEHASHLASSAVASQRRVSLSVGIAAASTVPSNRLMAACAAAQQRPTRLYKC